MVDFLLAKNQFRTNYKATFLWDSNGYAHIDERVARCSTLIVNTDSFRKPNGECKMKIEDYPLPPHTRIRAYAPTSKIKGVGCCLLLMLLLALSPLSVTACSDPCVEYDRLSAMGESFDLRPDAREIRDSCMNPVTEKLSGMTEWDGTRWLVKQTQWKYGGRMTKYRIESERNMEGLQYMATSPDSFAYSWTPKNGSDSIGNIVLGNYSIYSYVEITHATIARNGTDKFHVVVKGKYTGERELGDLTKLAVFQPLPQYLKDNKTEVFHPVRCRVNGQVSYTVENGDNFVCRFAMRANIDMDKFKMMRGRFKSDDETMMSIIGSSGIQNDMRRAFFSNGTGANETKEWREFLKVADFGTVLQ